jgi:hypothetical protein
MTHLFILLTYTAIKLYFPEGFLVVPYRTVDWKTITKIEFFFIKRKKYETISKLYSIPVLFLYFISELRTEYLK